MSSILRITDPILSDDSVDTKILSMNQLLEQT